MASLEAKPNSFQTRQVWKTDPHFQTTYSNLGACLVGAPQKKRRPPGPKSQLKHHIFYTHIRFTVVDLVKWADNNGGSPKTFPHLCAILWRASSRWRFLDFFLFWICFFERGKKHHLELARPKMAQRWGKVLGDPPLLSCHLTKLATVNRMGV